MTIDHPGLRGLTAGFVATTLLSLLSLTRGWLPQLDLVTVLDHIGEGLLAVSGLPSIPAAGWILHFAVGTLWWGVLFGIIWPILPGQQPWARGAWFGLGASLLVMLMVMPLAGAGYFGMQISPLAPLVTILLHVIYGAVLGAMFGHLTPQAAPRSA